MRTLTFDETKWQLVPIEPEENILDALYSNGFDAHDGDLTIAYKAMLQAAPQPEPVDVEPVAWGVREDQGDSLVSWDFIAGWPQAAHEHINDAILQWKDAGAFVPKYSVIPLYLHPDPEVVKLRSQLALAREALQTLIDEHEECTDADDWMAFMCSPEAIHAAEEALAQLGEK